MTCSSRNILKNKFLLRIKNQLVHLDRCQFSSVAQNEVLFKSINGNGLIVLNRPQHLNICSIPMAKSILSEIRAFLKHHKMIVIRGQGQKAFCAGGDIRYIHDTFLQKSPKDDCFVFYEIMSLIHHMDIPYVALMDGLALGGGLSLGVLGRYRVATEKSVFAMPENSIGLFPDSGSIYFLNRIRLSEPGVDEWKRGNKFGLYLALTGHQVRGSDNLRVGLATHMCSSNQLPLLEEELLALKDSRPNSDLKIEQILHRFTESCPDSLRLFSFKSNLAQLEKCFSGNSVEEIFLRLKADSSDWAAETLQTLNKMSPTSLKVTFKYFHLAQNLDLRECLMLDAGLISRMAREHNFMEGVRAMLVEKDRNPKWIPTTLNNVSDSHIDSIFELLKKKKIQLDLD